MPANKRPYLTWLGVGLVLRILIAPFTAQSDMFAVYWRAASIAYDGQVFSSYLVNMGAHWVHALWLLITTPIMPDHATLWTHPWWWAQSEWLAPQYMTALINRPDIYWILAILKTPYALADLGTGLLLVMMGAKVSPQRRLGAWIFWMLSPIGLYASYAFGRYEMFAVICVVGALMLFEGEHFWASALVLGVGVTMRSYPILLIPLFAMFVPLAWWTAPTRDMNYRIMPADGRLFARLLLAQILWAATALVPFGLVMAINKAMAGTVGELATLSKFHTGNTFFAFTIPVAQPGNIFVFILFAMIVYLVIFMRAHQLVGVGGLHMSELWVWLAVFHAGIFAFGTFSLHYFAWFLPFIALAIMRRPTNRSVLLLHGVQIVAAYLLVDVMGGGTLTGGLWAPMDPTMMAAAPTLQDLWLTKPEMIDQVAGLMRTVFTAATVVMMWPFVYELYSRATPHPVASEDWPRADYVRRSRRGDRRGDRRARKEGRREDDASQAGNGGVAGRVASPARAASQSAGRANGRAASRDSNGQQAEQPSAGQRKSQERPSQRPTQRPSQRSTQRPAQRPKPAQAPGTLPFSGSHRPRGPMPPTRVVDITVESDE